MAVEKVLKHGRFHPLQQSPNADAQRADTKAVFRRKDAFIDTESFCTPSSLTVAALGKPGARLFPRLALQMTRDCDPH